jgi:hypothetical protein
MTIDGRFAVTGLEMTDSERATLRVALSRFKLELERPGGLLGAGANADALRLQHLRNVNALTSRLFEVQATDER